MSDVLNRIKSAREERVKDLHFDFPVPTWGGDLVARFRVLSRPEMEKFGNTTRNSEVDCDFVIRSCSELYVLDPDKEVTGAKRMDGSPEYVRVEDEAGQPVQFDDRLAAKLDQDQLANAREVVLYVFDNNAIALGALVVRLITWMQNTDRDVSEGVLGE